MDIHTCSLSCFYGMMDNLKLSKTAPNISIFSLLTRVPIFFSSAAARYR